MPPIFADRRDAGRRLAAALAAYAGRPDVVVLGLPRGGVPVAHEVARALGVPFDVFVVRKVGVPGHEELAMGAIASGGVRVENPELMRQLGVEAAAFDRVAEREARELERREVLYRQGTPFPDLRGRTVLLVDDGLATGATETCDRFAREVDDIVCATTPEPFYAVGLWYADFTATSDEEVVALLDEERRRVGTAT